MLQKIKQIEQCTIHHTFPILIPCASYTTNSLNSLFLLSVTAWFLYIHIIVDMLCSFYGCLVLHQFAILIIMCFYPYLPPTSSYNSYNMSLYCNFSGHIISVAHSMPLYLYYCFCTTSSLVPYCFCLDSVTHHCLFHAFPLLSLYCLLSSHAPLTYCFLLLLSPLLLSPILSSSPRRAQLFVSSISGHECKNRFHNNLISILGLSVDHAMQA